ncbi:hypothetical protein HD554DRAFT_2038390 [Boletus coccyginus]|nr:hypothetical protein HD554DRAFT_2038390 [Boletus coccyginus]
MFGDGGEARASVKDDSDGAWVIVMGACTVHSNCNQLLQKLDGWVPTGFPHFLQFFYIFTKFSYFIINIHEIPTIPTTWVIDVFLVEPVQVIASARAKNGSASEASTSSGDVVKAVKCPRTLIGFADAVFKTTQQDCHWHELLTCTWARFIVHANIPLSAAENWYFYNFMDEIQPSYNVPFYYIEEIACLKDRKRLIFLIDGWEDKLKQSLYGFLAAEVNKYPVVLNLGDMTGCQRSAIGLMETVEQALKTIEVKDGENFIAITTNNPTIMQAFQWGFWEKFYWVLMSDFKW